MILKLSIVGLFIVLVVVLTVTYYTQLEGFIASKSAISVLATSGNLNFTCAPDTDIRGGKGNGTVYKVSRNNKGVSVISKSAESTATTMVSNCGCLKLGKNVTVNVLMCNPNADDTSSTDEDNTVVNTPAATATTASSNTAASTAANPQRNDVQPQVAMSNTSYDAMNLKQKSDLLTNIQKMFRNELLANRSTDASIKDTSPSSSSHSSSTQQGNEFNKASQKCDGSSDEDSYRCPKNPDGSCPPMPDMTQYIKKDAIPCWGCSVDY